MRANSFFKQKIVSAVALFMVMTILLTGLALPQLSIFADEVDITESSTGKSVSDFGTLLDTATQFIVIKHKALGGSHYAYTEAVTDGSSEYNFNPGSQMVLLTLYEQNGIVQRREEILLESSEGVLRDPDVSEDGTKVLFSWKQSGKDDYHLYEMDLDSRRVTQLTFGSGVADIEPKYLGNGKIVFNSTRCIETVDCWWTAVSNLYICDEDGSNIIRVGYDQVHTTYPTVTEDGRVLYTRWDYNDRTQMYVQGIFQMFADGTNQTEVYGNDSNFPTTLLHTREVPGSSGLYVSISSGHHTWQGGKLVLVDTTKGRNDADAITYPFDRGSTSDNEDGQNQSGPIYKYPVALNDHEFLVSYARNGWDNSDKRSTKFGIYYMNSETNTKILISHPTDEYGASQIAMIKTREIFERPSMVNQAVEYGTYYMGNVYEGEGMEGVEFGAAKYLRIVELEFRSSAIGGTIGAGYGSSDQYSPVGTGNSSWDVKRVLGIVDIEEDGSALFKVPANTPVYFQVLNADGEMIQTMRSWSTLMANETFSCVGCHEDKNTVPPYQSTTTLAMQKGVQTIRPDLWMTDVDEDTYDAAEDAEGFSYTEEIQPILDANCISCHNNTAAALLATASTDDGQGQITEQSLTLFEEASRNWFYTTEELGDNEAWYRVDYNTSGWSKGQAPFGTFMQRTDWNSSRIYARNTFTVDNVESLKSMRILLKILYDENPKVYLNGELLYSHEGYLTDYVEQDVTDAFLKYVKQGENVIAVSAVNTGGGQVIDLGIYASERAGEGQSQISLEGKEIPSEREGFSYLLSYLVLTGSTNKGTQYQGDPENQYINWVSSMSQPTILDPYQFGSTQSPLIERLKDGHGNLTAEQIQAIAAWIDLGVPFRGSYIEAVNWDANTYNFYYERVNERAYYDTADEVTKRILAGTEATDFMDLTVTYSNSRGKEIASITDSGFVVLYLDSKMKAGDTVTITLPEGIQYFYFNLTPRMEEALIYCPSGTYTYTLPSNLRKILPSSVTDKNMPFVTVRIATAEELATEQNLALNPYDSTENSASYPHANASSLYDDSAYFAARNAIDGFLTNNGHGDYPVQSWGPEQNPTDLWYEINFGNTVYVSSLAITIRADFENDHDTNFTSAVLEFSDGSTQEITLEKTADAQIIQIEGGKKATSYVRLANLQKDGDAWAALTEVEVFGTVTETFTPTLDGITATNTDWEVAFNSGTTEYAVEAYSSRIRLLDLVTSNTDSMLIRVNGTDVQYFASNGGAKIDMPERDNVVKIILNGKGGTTVYTLNITNTAAPTNFIWWVIGICAGIVAIGVVAILLILKPSRKPKQKAADESVPAEATEEAPSDAPAEEPAPEEPAPEEPKE